MIGYPIFLKFINLVFKPKPIKQCFNNELLVTYIIVAHNEEKVILGKLNNAIELDYPLEKIQFIVASDNSTDSTNSIVESFIKDHPMFDILLYCSVEHKGKTNAQNEAVRFAKGEILIMTDTNTLVNRNAVKKLVSCFVEKEIVYVCGKLEYVNTFNKTGDSESTYWDYDLSMRDIESRINTTN